MNPTPTNEVANSYFTRGGWGLNNDPFYGEMFAAVEVLLLELLK